MTARAVINHRLKFEGTLLILREMTIIPSRCAIHGITDLSKAPEVSSTGFESCCRREAFCVECIG
jgi:hypothetical protein